MSTLPSTDPCAGDSPGCNVVLVSNLTESTEHVTTAPGLVQSPLPTAPTDHMHSEISSEIIQASEVNGATDAPTVVIPNNAAAEPASSKRVTKRRKNHPTGTSNEPGDAIAARQRQVEARIAALELVVDTVESVPPTLVPAEVAQPTRASSAARDIWWHVRPVDTNKAILKTECEACIKEDAAYQESLDFSTLQHPTAPFLRCINCMKTLGVTKVWANRSHGLTKVLRDHMESHHPVSYYAKCQVEGLTKRCANMKLPGNTQPEFTRPGLVDRLVDWVVTNDEALNVVEDPEFRDLILYCGQGKIKDQDIPHRDKLATAAWAMYLLEKGKIDSSMKHARGRISLTSDLWSDTNLRSFMAVTAHYIDEYGTLQDHLISFRKIDGQHTGANVGQALYEVLQESGIVSKVGYVTLDNASNNHTLMQELSVALSMYGTEFDAERNRIRCFPHVMNLAVSAILKGLDDTAAAFRTEMQVSDLPIDAETKHYLLALESKPIDVVRASVAACRASGQRREALRSTIVDGNRLGRFHQPGGGVYLLPVLQLLRDVPTRWSSTYNMTSRYIDLYPAVVEFAFRVRHEAHIPILSHKQYEVAQDILTVLTVAHNAQELLSAEKTPTLALAFPVYEAVIENWDRLCIAMPELAHAITCGIAKLQEYIRRTENAPVHALAMVVNPSLKLDWIDQHWTPAQSRQAEATVKAEMLRFQTAIDSDLRAARTSAAAAARANRAQNHGYMRLLTSGANLRRASSMHASGETTTPRQSLVTSTSRSLSPRASSSQSLYQPVDPQARNQAIVEDEFTRYIDAETIPVDQMGTIELTEYWKVHQYTYPLLFRIAMDVLPAQASSVSSERVFSSSKLTCTSARNRITPENMEYLQVLKHALARRRREVPEGSASQDLDFVSHLYENLVLEDD